jgi:RNA polymerase sigma-70 factor, ECF subfamily
VVSLSHPPPLDPSALARESESIRRLARALLRDGDRADDAAQETLKTALERGPRAGFEPAAWLRGVLRNVVRRARRTETRRAVRERVAALRALPPEAASAERLAERRAVIEAVLTLPESLRTAVELRFFEGLPPRAMAARLRVPVATCRTRVRRGIAALRAELDRRGGGDGRRWALGLATLVPGPGAGLSSLATGGLLVSTQAKAAAAAVLLVLLGVGGVGLWASRREDREPAGDSPATIGARDRTAALAPAASDRRREDAASAPPRDGGGALRVTGLVVDGEGLPIPGATVHVAPADTFDDPARAPDARADAEGRFVVVREGQETSWRIRASAPGRRSALATATAGAPRDIVLRLSRTAPLWLSVRDGTADRPIQGAEVVLVSADAGGSRTQRTRTDAEGLTFVEDPGARPIGFELVAQVTVTAGGHAGESFPLDTHHVPGATSRERPHPVRLWPAKPTAVRVFAADGSPAAGAMVFGWDGGAAGSVSLGTSLETIRAAIPIGPVRTDGAGRAEVVLPSGPWWLLATRETETAFRAGHTSSRAYRVEEPTAVEMRLAPSLGIDGVVVDEDATPVGNVGVRMDWFTRLRTSPESHVALPPEEMQDRFATRTDVEGKFVLRDLPRPPAGTSITVAVWPAPSAGSWGSAEVDPSDGKTKASVRIQMKRMPSERRRIHVVTANGAPVKGALVHVESSYPGARTDRTGTALLTLFPGLAARGVVVEAPGFATRRVTLDGEPSGATVEVVLEPEAVLDVAVRDGEGRAARCAQVTVVEDGTAEQVATSVSDRSSGRRLAFLHSDVEGRVRIDGLPRGPLHVDAWLPDAGGFQRGDLNRRRLRCEAPGSVEIALPRAAYDPARGSRVEGEVVEADGSPIATYTAALQSDSLGQFAAASTGRRFRFEGIPAGTWQLQIYAGIGPSVPILADVEVRAGQDLSDLRLVRVLGGTIAGRVVAPGTSELRGLPVEAVDTRGMRHVRGRAHTGPGGVFRIEDVPAGPMTLRLSAPGYDHFRRGAMSEAPGPLGLYAIGEPVVDVRGGAETTAELRAAPGARLVVRCEDERLAIRPDKFEGAALYANELNTNLVLTWPDGRNETAFGLYRGRNDTPWVLAPGCYRLRVLRFDEPTHDVVVERANEVEVTVTFAR